MVDEKARNAAVEVAKEMVADRANHWEIADAVIEAYLQALSPGSTGETEGWRDLMEELANDLEAEIEARYPPEMCKYPSIAAKADLDMEPVRRARAMLSAAGERG